MESADGNLVGVGEKRAAEGDGRGGEGVGGMSRKRMRYGEDGDVVLGEKEMRRVAEIVMVLSVMGRMRGGKEPTVAERDMMAEARQKVVAMCGEMAPRDILPREAFGGLIEDLGLNHLKEVRLGSRPPRFSIVEKMEAAKRRMEEAKAAAAQAASRPPQRLQTASVGAVENHGAATMFPSVPSDKQGIMPVPSATVHLGHASSMTSAAMTFQPRTHETKPSMVSPGLANSNVERAFPSALASRVEVAASRQDARPNGSSFTPHVPVASSAEQHLVRHITPPAKTPPTLSTHAGMKTRTMEHGQNMKVNAPHKTPQATNIQNMKPVIAQTTPAVLSGMHQSVQDAHFLQTPPIFNRHVEISKVVQKLLHPKLPEQPNWTPPSRDYMNRSLTCQLCKSCITEVDGALVCDACEKGYHVKCLQSLNQKVIPKGEWHCHRCLSITNGKPFPPKYGRVTRNMNPPKAPPNPTAVQSSADQNLCHPNVTNGDSEKGSSSHAGIVAVSFSVSKSAEVNVVGMDVNKHGKHNSESFAIEAVREEGVTCAPSPAVSLCDRPAQHVLKSESVANSENCATDVASARGPASSSPSDVSPSDKPSEPELMSETLQHGNSGLVEAESDVLVKSPTRSDQLQAFGDHNVTNQQEVSEGAEAQLEELEDNSNGVLRPLEKSDMSESHDFTPNHDSKIDYHEVRREFHPSLDSEDRLLDVDWIGVVCSTVDEKKFYQSCSISGVVYEVHDYVLFQLDNEKLVPSKLEAMWEDSHTSTKWVTVDRCYYPSDLPDYVGHPCAPEINEVYESNHGMTLMAGSIRGPCKVIFPFKFGQENNHSNHGTCNVDAGKCPVFVCKWFYDEIKGVFRPIPS